MVLAYLLLCYVIKMSIHKSRAMRLV